MPSAILAEFLDEAREHLQAANQQLLILETEPDNPEALHGVLRSLHTIKGNAGFLDLKHLYRLTHKAEDILQGLRENNDLICRPELLDALFHVLDALESMLDSLERGGYDLAPGLNQVLEELDRAGAATGDESLPGLPAGTFGSGEACLPGKEQASGLAGQAEAFLGLIRNPSPEARDGLFWRRLAREQDLMSAEMKFLCSPASLRMWNITRQYLAELMVYERPCTEDVICRLEELAEALVWGVKKNIRDDDGFRIIRPEREDFKEGGRHLAAKLMRSAGTNGNGVIVDLTMINTLSSPQIGVLVTALKRFPNRKRLGLVVDPETQAGLDRVFRVLGLKDIFNFFPCEAEARMGLRPSVQD